MGPPGFEPGIRVIPFDKLSPAFPISYSNVRAISLRGYTALPLDDGPIFYLYLHFLSFMVLAYAKLYSCILLESAERFINIFVENYSTICLAHQVAQHAGPRGSGDGDILQWRNSSS